MCHNIFVLLAIGYIYVCKSVKERELRLFLSNTKCLQILPLPQHTVYWHDYSQKAILFFNVTKDFLEKCFNISYSMLVPLMVIQHEVSIHQIVCGEEGIAWGWLLCFSRS